MAVFQGRFDGWGGKRPVELDHVAGERHVLGHKVCWVIRFVASSMFPTGLWSPPLA